MFAFILQRLIQAIMVMVSVAFIAFLLFQYVGDPVLFMLGQDATQDQIDALRKDLGLDQSFIVQFGHFLWNAVQGEFGISLRQGAKVSQLIADRFPATLELALIAAGLALVVGHSHGCVCRTPTWQLVEPIAHDLFSLGCVAAHFPHWHFAHIVFCRAVRMVSQFWPG
jgi:peptide/nickel transport system permease protein